MFWKKKNKDTNQVLEKIDGRSLKYVSCRDSSGVEIILGKNGRLVVTENEIAAICEGKDLFAYNRENVVVSELMSHNGICIDVDTQDGKKTYYAYYTYYRK